MSEWKCKHCGHTEARHPNGFMCDTKGCRCPGWVKLVKGVNDGR